MGNKEDWEELEKWNEERQKEKDARYGITRKEMEASEERINKLVSDLKFTGITLSFSTVVLLILIVAIFFTIVYILITDSNKQKVVDTSANYQTVMDIPIN